MPGARDVNGARGAGASAKPPGTWPEC